MADIATVGQITFDRPVQAVAVTKSDTTDLGKTRAIYVGTQGDLAVLMSGDSDANSNAAAVTLKNVANGTYLNISVRKVMSSNTSASDIIALY